MDLNDLGGSAISADHPAGEDVRGTAEFDALQAEIDRVNDTANPGQTDWSRVVQLAGMILETQGKDLLVASYLAVGLTRRQGVEGFALGLRVLRDMLVQHWDGLFPSLKRMRGRRNALQYWLDAADDLLRAADPAPLEPALVDAMRTCIDEIDTLLREKDEEPPAVFRLMALVNGFPVRVEAPAPEPDSGDNPAGTPDAASAQSGASAGPIISDEDAQRVIDDAFGAMQRAAEYFYQNDAANPLCYRIGRWRSWSRIVAVSVNADGATPFPGPLPHHVEMLAALEGGADPWATTTFAEGQLDENPLWLDPHRAAARALESAGPEYAAAARAVLMETALVAARFDAHGARTFVDGIPLASADTRAWLCEAGTGGEPGSAAANRPGSPGDGVWQAVARYVDSGDILGAAAALQEAIGKAADAGARYGLRVKLAETLLALQSVANPWPFVQPLLEDIDRHRLDEWDPRSAVSGLRVVFLAIVASGEAAPVTPPAQEVLRRIALLDYAEALRLSGAG